MGPLEGCTVHEFAANPLRSNGTTIPIVISIFTTSEDGSFFSSDPGNTTTSLDPQAADDCVDSHTGDSYAEPVLVSPGGSSILSPLMSLLTIADIMIAEGLVESGVLSSWALEELEIGDARSIYLYNPFDPTFVSSHTLAQQASLAVVNAKVAVLVQLIVRLVRGLNDQLGAGSSSGTTLCTETSSDCSYEYASDGVCDDGGPGAEYSICEIGTDCTDCGSRVDASVRPPPPSPDPPPPSAAQSSSSCVIFYSDATCTTELQRSCGDYMVGGTCSGPLASGRYYTATCSGTSISVTHYMDSACTTRVDLEYTVSGDGTCLSSTGSNYVRMVVDCGGGGRRLEHLTASILDTESIYGRSSLAFTLVADIIFSESTLAYIDGVWRLQGLAALGADDAAANGGAIDRLITGPILAVMPGASVSSCSSACQLQQINALIKRAYDVLDVAVGTGGIYGGIYDMQALHESIARAADATGNRFGPILESIAEGSLAPNDEEVTSLLATSAETLLSEAKVAVVSGNDSGGGFASTHIAVAAAGGMVLLILILVGIRTARKKMSAGMQAALPATQVHVELERRGSEQGATTDVQDNASMASTNEGRKGATEARFVAHRSASPVKITLVKPERSATVGVTLWTLASGKTVVKELAMDGIALEAGLAVGDCIVQVSIPSVRATFRGC